ncbi:hypothetical protein B566_EDAN010505 [Ephemera danica]|nr:hypothetical protein B566_EDAN010505 [Ephemera danica]
MKRENELNERIPENRTNQRDHSSGKDYAEQVEHSLTAASLAKFGRLSTDEARIKFCLGIKSTHCLQAKPFFRAKSAEDAAGLRDQAELFLQVGNAKAALQLLSRSIMRSPSPAEIAKLAFASAAQLLDSGEENVTWRNELIMASKRCEEQLAITTECVVSKVPELPKLTAGESGNLASASRLVEVAHAEELGRYVRAAETIHVGDTLLVEPAYVACLLTEKSGTHCHHCFARLVAPVACPVCSGVAFCGPDCQAEACDTYHKVECRFNNLFIGSGMSILCHMALRMITRAGSADKFVAMWKAANQGTAKSKKQQAKEEAEIDNYRRVLGLVSHQTQRTTKDFLHRSLMAIFLLKCLQQANFFTRTSKTDTDLNETESLVAQALLKHLQILQFNAHEVLETLARAKNRIKGSRTQYLGVALYSSVALFNHDCYPGVAREVCLAMDALRVCLAARWGTVVIPEIKEKPPQDPEDRVTTH